MRIVFLAAAGALGVLARYGVATAVGPTTFPWATLAINLLGSFALGVLVVLATDDVRLIVGVGFLGAFTTFSTFSVDTVTMLRAGRTSAALAYVALSLTGGVAMAALGYRVAVAR